MNVNDPVSLIIIFFFAIVIAWALCIRVILMFMKGAKDETPEENAHRNRSTYR